MKHLVIACILLTALLAGCGPRGAAKPADTTPAPTAAPTTATAPAGDPAAKALNLTADQVLYRAPFKGGSLGDRTFHGGEVLLWKSGDNKYSVGAALDMGGGVWRASTVSELTADPEKQRFAVAARVLNDSDSKERAVPLYVFFGAVNHPRIETVEVAHPDINLIPITVRNGVWLAVYQGAVTLGPEQPIEINGCDHGGHALYTETPNIQ